MDFTEYVMPELLVLIPVLYAIGVWIKASKVPDHRIPFILGGLGIILSGLWLFATKDFDGSKTIALAIFTALVQGVLVAAAAVFANQLIKQYQESKGG